MEPLTRINYRDPATGAPQTQQTLKPDSLVDYENYLLRWGRAHASTLHSPGVASGLEVQATPGTMGVRVLPGVAVTADGDHVVLAVGGRAVIGGSRVPVPPAGGVAVPTANLDGDHVLLVSPDETLDQRSINGGERKVVDHTPRLKMQPAGPAAGRGEVVLARVTLAGGTVTALDVGGRVPSAGTTTISRSRVGTSGSDLEVKDDVAARLRHVAGGLTVAAAGRFTVEADALELVSAAGTMTLAPGRLTFAGAVEIPNGLVVRGGALDAQQGLRVTGGAVTAATIGPTDVVAGLRLTGPLTLDGAVTVSGGALTLDQITPTAGQLTVSKGMRVTGSLDAQQGARVTGALSVSGDLHVDRIAPNAAQLEVTKGLTVTGALTVSGGALTVDQLTPAAGQLTVSKGLTVAGGLLDARQALRVTGALTVDQVTPTAAQLEVTKGLRVSGGLLDAQKGLTVTGALTVSGGAFTVDQVTPAAGRLTVSKGLTVAGGLLDARQGLTVTGTLTAERITSAQPDPLITVDGDLRVDGAVTVGGGFLAVLDGEGTSFDMFADTGRLRLSGGPLSGARPDRIIVDKDGKVGIGPAAPRFALDVQGTVCGVTFCNPSDARLKSDVVPLDDVLARLAAVRGVRFRSALGDDDRPRVGVLAQEVEVGFPDLVIDAGPDRLKAVDYGGFVGVLVAAVNELASRGAALSRRLSAVEHRAAEQGAAEQGADGAQ